MFLKTHRLTQLTCELLWTTIISVADLVKFWTHKILPKFCLKFRRYFRQYFASFLSNFPAPQKLVEKLYIRCSPIFSFLSKFWNYNFSWNFEYCGQIRKIQYLGLKISQNFPWIIDEIFDAATLTTILKYGTGLCTPFKRRQTLFKY